MEKIELVDGLEDITLQDLKNLEIVYLVFSAASLFSLIAFLIWSGNRGKTVFLIIPICAVFWGALHVCRLVVRNYLNVLKFVRLEEQAMDLATNTLQFGENIDEARKAASDLFYEMNDPSDILDRNFTVRKRHFILGIGVGLMPVCLWYGIGIFIRITLETGS